MPDYMQLRVKTVHPLSIASNPEVAGFVSHKTVNAVAVIAEPVSVK